MTVPAFHVEAKLHAFRKTQEGVVVSFVVSPVDMPPQLALDPLGTRYMLALAAIGDDELPVEPPSLPPAERPGVETGSSPTARARASEMGKERYRNSTPMEQALARACRLSDDERFCAWAGTEAAGTEAAEAYLELHGAAQFIRDHCCDGNSRKLIAEDPEAYRKFLALETMFKIAVGELPEIRS